eukprot:5633260-Pleurochrysis_carterae.AAC.3
MVCTGVASSPPEGTLCTGVASSHGARTFVEAPRAHARDHQTPASACPACHSNFLGSLLCGDRAPELRKGHCASDFCRRRLRGRSRHASHQSARGLARMRTRSYTSGHVCALLGGRTQGRASDASRLSGDIVLPSCQWDNCGQCPGRMNVASASAAGMERLRI